ncbi:lipoyl synthase [Permianibacter aggregans]|uniref:Lipoyl synthase n=1 Tax=Permianibacter aggregans TaxID=1510150 RepID=A0A4R6U9B5_9GAMM|nr:lipoyl synthase [Permianibacter aggregans]QGX39290.1 lipoyl synthase [Permianibacter aggregans]TDQ42416.1 lipoic acid synthetase [Permianibacter aggregans]
MDKPVKAVPGEKLRAADKLARIPVKIEPLEQMPRKPDWIRVRLPSGDQINKVKNMLRDNKLHTVCEEASCPNLPECFSHGTATFMIMGDICTRRCAFCDVAHGRPLALDPNEPLHMAETIQKMGLKYVVITSVDRDDLRDGGAQHFVDCIVEARKLNPNTKLEVLVPDFRGRMDVALDIFANGLPDVFNHNLETVPHLYKAVRPGSDYQHSMDLLKKFKERYPGIPTKSGLMLGLGETNEQIVETLKDMRKHEIDWLTLGQYLAPSRHHFPVKRFVTPKEFDELGAIAKDLGFSNVASGPMVRSSYHADKQAAGEKVS